MPDNEWTTEWPTEPGMYWLYGWTFTTGYTKPPSFHYVQVRMSGNSRAMYITEGNFMWNNGRDGMGIWQPVSFPDVPNPRAFKEVPHE